MIDVERHSALQSFNGFRCQCCSEDLVVSSMRAPNRNDVFLHR
jgi:hypothetical protein